MTGYSPSEKKTDTEPREHRWDGLPMVPAYMCLDCEDVHQGANPPKYGCRGKKVVTYER